MTRSELIALAGLAWLAALFVGAFLLVVLGNPTPGAPLLLEPAEGAALRELTPTFTWRSAAHTVQVEFELVPEKPAAGIGFIATDKGSFAVPPRDSWCCLREGVSYRWQIGRASCRERV